MNYLGTPILYDPAGAVTKAINALQAMTAFDTTNLRLAITVPAHGMVGFRIRCALEGANNNESTILLGVMVGASVKGRVLAFRGWPGVNGTAGANFSTVLDVDIIITGLATGATNFDAAYGIENVGAASPNGIKYGGPDNTTISDAWGGFYFAAYDPQPLPTATAGAVGGIFIAGTNAATTITAAAGSNALTLTGGAASGATPAGHGLKSTGGAASTTGGGTAGTGFILTGGAGAASGNGAAEGFTVTAGGNTTVNGANALSLTGTGAFNGLLSTGGPTGNGAKYSGGGTSGTGMYVQATAGNSSGMLVSGSGNQDGIQVLGGATGNGFQLFGGATSGDGVKITTTAGHGFNTAASGTNKHGIFSTGGTAGTSDGIKAAAGTGGVDLRANITGNITGTLDTVTTATNLTNAATAGDFTATMKTSIGTAVAASAVASVTGNVGGNVVGSVGSVVGAVGSVTGAVGSVTARVTANTDQWAGGTIPTPNTTGVPIVDTRNVLRTGTAQATGNSTTTIKLDASASATDNFYKYHRITVVSGTGSVESAICTAYVGSTKIATVAPAWPTAPDNTSVFVITADAQGDVEAWGGSAPNALISGRVDANTQATASSLTFNLTGNVTGNLSGSVGSVTSGVTVTTNNDKTGYSLTVTPPTAATIATTVWTDLLASSDFSTASSIGKLLKDDIDATISSRGTATGTALTSAQVATAVWTDTTAGDFTTALSIGKSVLNGVTLGTGLTVAAVSGAVGSVTGAVGSVTARVTANTDQLAGQTVTAAAGVTFPTSVASPTNITAGTITTTTNLTNAPTAGDFTSTMKTSLNAATPASVTGAVGSVTGDVGGKVLGGGSGTITGTGVRAIDGSGNAIAPASSALSTATWTGTLATNLTTLASHDPGATLGTSTLTQTQVTGGAYDVQSVSCVLGDARIAHLNADITSRMASYTQPTGFLAATFPAVVSDFDETTDVVAHVTLVDTTTDVTDAVTIGDVTLAASQPNYAPAMAGDAMTLTAAYDAAKTAAQAATALSTAQWTNLRAANLDNLNATVSSRLAASSYTAPDNAGIAAIEAKTSNLPADPASDTTVNAVAGDVWDVTLASHLTPGSTGFALNAAGSAGDPWATSLPGAYGAGEAGYIVGNNLNAAITSRSTFDPASDTVAHVTLTDTATTLTNKTGFGLAANGLDAISVADPGAPANWTTLPKVLVALFRRLAFGKVVKDATAGEIRTYADNGTTVNATQAFTVTASTETLEEAT